jgi:hypothetical protein
MIRFSTHVSTPNAKMRLLALAPSAHDPLSVVVVVPSVVVVPVVVVGADVGVVVGGGDAVVVVVVVFSLHLPWPSGSLPFSSSQAHFGAKSDPTLHTAVSMHCSSRPPCSSSGPQGLPTTLTH